MYLACQCTPAHTLKLISRQCHLQGHLYHTYLGRNLSLQLFVVHFFHCHSGPDCASRLPCMQCLTHCVLKSCLLVSCSWLTAVEWEESGPGGSSLRVWDAVEAPVHVPKPVMDPLPSDSRFRQDLHALQVRMDAAPASFCNAGKFAATSGKMQTLMMTYTSEWAHIQILKRSPCSVQEGDQDKAQEWKSRLEHVQRTDAALRTVGQQSAGL